MKTISVGNNPKRVSIHKKIILFNFKENQVKQIEKFSLF